MCRSLQAAERLVERMRRFRPDVVITFGGDGGMNYARGPHDGLVLDDGGVSLGRAGETFPCFGGCLPSSSAVLPDDKVLYSGPAASPADAMDGDARCSLC